MNDVASFEPISGLRDRFRAYLEAGIAGEQAAASPADRLAWRLSRYDNGLKLLELASQLGVDVARSRVLDAGCAFGGDILPFAAAGADAFASDYLDHRFAALQRFARDEGLRLTAFPADSMRLPLAGDLFDLVLSLDVIEHVPDDARFAAEIGRVLKPGGIALITTPARWKFLHQDPHYGVPLLHALPNRLRTPVARHVFRRDYPYPVYRIYGSLEEAARPFRAVGLSMEALLPWSGRARQLEPLLPSALFRMLRDRFWEVLLVRKS